MISNIRILLTIPFFYPHKGGAQKYAEELYAKIVELYPTSKIDILCYNTDNAKRFESYRGMDVYRVPCYNIIPGKFVFPKLIPLVLTLKKLYRNKYHFVNSHTAFFDTTWWAWFYAKIIGAKSIFTGHAPGQPTHHTKKVELIGKLLHMTVGKWTVGKYDIYTYANSKTKVFFEKTMGVKKHGHIIHIAINNKVFNGDNKTTGNNPVTKESEAIWITYVGRLIETKGVNYLYEAIKRLRNNTPAQVWSKLKFIFVGPGPLIDSLTQRAQADQLEQKIIITGDMESENIAAIMKNTDIFVSPSSHAEGLPTTILEAGACGCLVIATNSGSISDIVIDQKTGVLINMKSVESIEKAIEWAIKNPEGAKSIANNMQKMILQEFTWDIIAKKYYELLQMNI